MILTTPSLNDESNPNDLVDRITLTHELLDIGGFDLFDTEIFPHRNSVVLENTSDWVFTSDVSTCAALTFPGGTAGILAVNSAVNKLAENGGIPKHLFQSLIVREGLNMKDFLQIVKDIRSQAEKLGVEVSIEDIKAAPLDPAEPIMINSSITGTLHPKSNVYIRRICTGDKIILSGEMAQHGVAMVALQENARIEEAVYSDTRPIHNMTRALLHDFGPVIKVFKNPTHGGLAAAFRDLAANTDLGINIYGNKLPLTATVKDACYQLGLDPMYVENQGVFLTVVGPNHAHEVVNKLKTMADGKHAAIIGEVTHSHAGKVMLHKSNGEVQELEVFHSSNTLSVS